MFLMSEGICYNSDLSVKAYGAKIAECQKSNLKMHQLIIETDWKEITAYYGLRAGDEACLALWSALDYFFGEAYYWDDCKFLVLIPEQQNYQDMLNSFMEAMSKWHGFLVPNLTVKTEYSLADFSEQAGDDPSGQIPGYINRATCTLEKIDASHYKYSMLPAYVNIIRNEDGTWYYTRLKNISRSIDFYTLQECLEIAYYDMLASKL